jgi:hypothetical protein
VGGLETGHRLLQRHLDPFPPLVGIEPGQRPLTGGRPVGDEDDGGERTRLVLGLGQKIGRGVGRGGEPGGDGRLAGGAEPGTEETGGGVLGRLLSEDDDHP